MRLSALRFIVLCLARGTTLTCAAAGVPPVLRIGGLFPIFKTEESTPKFGRDGTGPQRQAGFLMAVRELNSRTPIPAQDGNSNGYHGKDAALKRWLQDHGVTIEVIIRDSKRDQASALFAAHDLLTESSSQPVSALVGPASSGPAESTSIVAGGAPRQQRKPVISYSATSPKLSNGKIHDYFFRTPPTDLVQANAWCDMLAHVFGWKQNIVVVAGDDNYGQGGADAFRTAAKAKDIEVAPLTVTVPRKSDRSTLRELVQRLRGATPRPRVLWMIMQQDDAKNFLLEAAEAEVVRPGVTVLGTDAVTAALKEMANHTDEFVRNITKGAFGLESSRAENETVRSAWFARWKAQPPANCTHDFDDGSPPRRLWQQDHDKDNSTDEACNKPQYAVASPARINSYAFYAYDAAYAVAHAVKHLFSDTSSKSYATSVIDGAELREHLLSPSLQFTGVTGDVYFNPGEKVDGNVTEQKQGDRVGAAFELINFGGQLTDQATVVGTWAQTRGYAHKDESFVLNFEFPMNKEAYPKNLRFSPEDGKWHPDHYEFTGCTPGTQEVVLGTGLNSRQCLDCPPGYWNKEFNAKWCNKCPRNAVCFGKDNISPLQDHFRFKDSSGICRGDLNDCKLPLCTTRGVCLGAVKHPRSVRVAKGQKLVLTEGTLPEDFQRGATIRIDGIEARVAKVLDGSACKTRMESDSTGCDECLAHVNNISATNSTNDWKWKCLHLSDVWSEEIFNGEMYAVANSTCAEGHNGTMCSECSIGYGRDYISGGCRKCQEKSFEPYVWLGFTMTFVLVAILIWIFSTLRRCEREFETPGVITQDNAPTVLFKILINWAQTMQILVAFNFEWPADVQSYFQAAGYSSFLGDRMVRFSCTLFADSGDSSLVFIPAVPIVLGVLIVIVCGIMYKLEVLKHSETWDMKYFEDVGLLNEVADGVIDASELKKALGELLHGGVHEDVSRLAMHDITIGHGLETLDEVTARRGIFQPVYEDGQLVGGKFSKDPEAKSRPKRGSSSRMLGLGMPERAAGGAKWRSSGGLAKVATFGPGGFGATNAALRWEMEQLSQVACSRAVPFDELKSSWIDAQWFKCLRRCRIAAIIVFFFFLHPVVSRVALELFNCMPVADDFAFLQRDMTIRCGSESHLQRRNVAAAVLGIFSIGLPLWLLRHLRRSKRMIDRLAQETTVRAGDSMRNVVQAEQIQKRKREIDAKAQEYRESHNAEYGFLYNGFKDEYPYWEMLIMFRKLCVMACTVFLSPYEAIWQALGVLFILTLAIVVQIRCQPFEHNIVGSPSARGSGRGWSKAAQSAPGTSPRSLESVGAHIPRAMLGSKHDGALKRTRGSSAEQPNNVPQHKINFNLLETIALASIYVTTFCAVIFAQGSHSTNMLLWLSVVVFCANGIFLCLFFFSCSKYATRKNLMSVVRSYIVKPIAQVSMCMCCRRDVSPRSHQRPSPISAHDIERELEKASSPTHQLPKKLSLGKSVSESGHGHRDTLWQQELGITNVEEMSSRTSTDSSARKKIQL